MRKLSGSPSRLSVPPADCRLCPRLARFREDNTRTFPEFHNAPVPSFGPPDARILIVGLAPGLKGANRTGRPFTGDYAGDLLYSTLLSLGLAVGDYGRSADDSLRLVDCRITNAVRCVPPQNKPSSTEIATCRGFLESELASLERLQAVIALGRIAHDAVVAARACVRAHYPFTHLALHELPDGLLLADSYHCSRYNTNTGRLSEAMFRAVFEQILGKLGPA